MLGCFLWKNDIDDDIIYVCITKEKIYATEYFF